MNVLMIGTAGPVAASLVRRLVADGQRLRAWSFDAPSAAVLRGLPVERVEGPLDDPEVVRSALDGVERVFYLPGVERIWAPPGEALERSEVDAMECLLDGVDAGSVGRFVHVSSCATIAPLSKGRPATEEGGVERADHPVGFVARQVRMETRVLARASEGTPAVIANTGFAIGSEDWGPGVAGRWILQILRGEAPGIPAGGLNVVGAEGVARGLQLVCESGRVGERYLLGGENLDYRELADRVAVIGDVAVPRRSISGPMAWAVGWVSEWLAQRGLNAEPTSTAAWARHASGFLYYSSEKARSELGYEPGGLEGALEIAVRWFRRQGSAPDLPPRVRRRGFLGGRGDESPGASA